MKLIIQIPCYNEEKSLPVTMSHLPRQVAGFDSVEWLIIDDGSTDQTAEIARALGADHVVRLPKNMGLAKAFMKGLAESLKRGADVIVNTDADNQYDASCIGSLTQPILDGSAELVIGTRPIDSIQHFSVQKKIFQKIGSWIVRLVSNTSVPDAPSGFRAIGRDAAMQMNVFNNYTYTIEMIIQAGTKNLCIASVPIKVNETLRPSRLMKSTIEYVLKSLATIIRIFVIYRPFRFFITIGLSLFSIGLVIGLRFLLLFLAGLGHGHVQSLILAAILLLMGSSTMLIAFLADQLAVNRRILEDIQYKLRVDALCKGRSNG